MAIDCASQKFCTRNLNAIGMNSCLLLFMLTVNICSENNILLLLHVRCAYCDIFDYVCNFRDSKSTGLKCLRDRLAGDELLLWTVETFTMFYQKTWAQRVVIPFIGLGPLFLSIFTFVYDNYSDIDLAYEYYEHAFLNVPVSGIDNQETIEACDAGEQQTASTSSFLHNNDSLMGISTTTVKTSLYRGDECTDIKRTPEEYRTAFIVNVICMCSALMVSYVMCARELIVHSLNFIRKHHWHTKLSGRWLAIVKMIIAGLCVFPTGVVLSPFFILYIGRFQKLC